MSDARDAVKPGAARVHADLASNVAAFVPMSYGDVDAAFKNAPHVFEEEMHLHRGAAMTLEGRAVLASYDPAADMLDGLVRDADAASLPRHAWPICSSATWNRSA